MPALDLLHDPVRHALEKDGWTITHHPLTLRTGGRALYEEVLRWIP
jgi:XisH protein